MFSVTEDRFTELDADADGLEVLAVEALDDDDDEQPATASPAAPSTVTA
jgi:hypothetical protein